MPKRYAAELDHEPLGWGLAEEDNSDNEVEVFVASFTQAADQLVMTLENRGMTLEEGEREAFLGDLEHLLIGFIIKCRAHPLRTPSMLVATAREIKREPDRLFREMNRYSPDAVAIVYQQFNRIFPGDVLLRWEAEKSGVAPCAETKIAAKAAVDVLRQKAEEQKMGRPRQEEAERFAVKLGALFLNAGGKLGRTRDYLSGQERGPFRQFLQLIIRLVDPLVMTTGHQLNPDTMVRWAQESLLAEGRGRRKRDYLIPYDGK